MNLMLQWILGLLHVHATRTQPQFPDRAIRNSPSGTYAPSPVVCPEGLHVRQSGLNVSQLSHFILFYFIFYFPFSFPIFFKNK